MRIFAIADLHLGVDHQGDLACFAMAQYLNRQATNQDALLILGDIGNSDETLVRCLALFADFPGKKMAVAGNHDIWVHSEQEERTSFERYRALNRIMAKCGYTSLDHNMVVVNDIGFAGCMGWYDYSFADLPGIPLKDYQKKTHTVNGLAWQWADAIGVDWDWDDEEATQWQLSHLKYQLGQLINKGVKKIVVGMHHAPTKKLLSHPRWLVPKQWRFLNAFLGSSKFEQLLSIHQKEVQHVLCGHIHRSASAMVDGIRYSSVGGNYKTKELMIVHPNGQIKRRRFSAQ